MSWETFKLSLADVKNYLKVEHDLDDSLIERLTAAAIKKASIRTNRDFDTVPADVELAIFKTIAWNYENRGDAFAVPPEAAETFQEHYSWPGL